MRTSIIILCIALFCVFALPSAGASQMIGGDMGWIRINCNIDGATVTFDDDRPGCTIAAGSCTKEVYTTSPPYSTFTVRKNGYTPYTGSVIWPGKGQTVDLYATLNPVPVPSYGSIRVSSSPSNAVASLDGLSWQYTPCTFSALSAGTSHTVQVSLSGYHTVTRTVTVPKDQTADISVTLDPVQPATGSLNIATIPSGADIYVDGRYYAESPSVVPGLAPGDHSLRLRKAGYQEYTSTVTVSSGRQVPVTVTLTAQSPSTGSLEVASVPPGSALYLDGNYMGLTPVNGFFDLPSLAAGYHTVLLRHTDYTDFTQQAYVTAGKSSTLNAQLSPVSPGPTPAQSGGVVIASVPAGADIYIDNVYKGVTPATLTAVPAGQHVLTLKHAGYQDAVQTITVTGGQSTPVAATLAEAAPEPTKSPVSFVAGIGAVLAAVALLQKRRRR